MNAQKQGGTHTKLAYGVAALTLAVVASHAVAQDATYRIDIPAESLAQALNDLGSATHSQVLFAPSLVANHSVAGLHGTYSASGGLQALLAGTSLSFHSTSSGVLVLSAPVAKPGEAPIAAASSSDNTTVIVTARGMGTRVARKNNLQTVDAIGPTDIDSLPSANIADVLKRLPGVQVTYDNGEAQQPNIRGVGFVQTLLDGREVVTAGYRNLQIGDIPADNVNAVNVYKTPSANLIEGGIGGVIDVRTKQPFDYRGFQMAGSVLGTADQREKKWTPNATLSMGDNWQTNWGRMGIAVAAAHTDLNERSDFTLENYTTSNELFNLNKNGAVGDAADTAIVPNSVFKIDINAHHVRDSQMVNLQWAPTQELEFRANFTHAFYRDDSTQIYLFANTPATNSAADSEDFTLQPGTNVLNSGTFASAGVTTQSLWVRPQRDLRQLSFSGKWETEQLTISGEADTTTGNSEEQIFIFAASGTAPTYNYANTGRTGEVAVMPTFSFPGYNLLNPANFGNMSYTDIFQDKHSLGNAEQLDVAYRPADGFFTALQAGIRFSERDSTSNQALGSGSITGTLANYPSLVTTDSRDEWVAANPLDFQDDSAFRSSVGLSSALPTDSPASFYQLHEKTSAAYIRALYKFSLFSFPTDGDLGVRVVKSDEDGTSYATGVGSPIPVTTNDSHTDALPSATLRVKLSDDLTFRASAAKTLGRPTLDQLSPAVSLGTTGTGSAGNPDLKPFYATGGDLGLDWYFSSAGYLTGAVFAKRVQGFIANEVFSETYGGEAYQISRPVNGGSGKIQGIEINYSQKFVFLPGWWSGFGADVNYTYIDSEEVSVVTNRLQQIDGLAKNTWNATGYYEKGPLLVRIAYSLNSKFINNDSLGAPYNGPEVFGRQGMIDGTIQYRVSPNLRLVANVLNASQPWVGYYNTNPGTPDNNYRTYRRYQLGFKFNY